jgi:hypothetical protein
MAVVEMISDAEIHQSLQEFADRHPVEYEALYRERTQRSADYCCRSHLLDRLADGDHLKRRALEQIDTLFWLAGVY